MPKNKIPLRKFKVLKKDPGIPNLNKSKELLSQRLQNQKNKRENPKTRKRKELNISNNNNISLNIDDYVKNTEIKQNEYLNKIAENSLMNDSSMKKFSKGC
jgi:hypothetical protein